MEKLVDEFNWLLRLLGDVIDGLESVQVLHADPFIEAHASGPPLRARPAGQTHRVFRAAR